MITSRPEIGEALLQINLNLEIKGFEEKEKNKYIENYFKSILEEEEIRKVKEMICKKEISFLSHSPLYLEMICLMIENRLKEGGKIAFKKQGELFEFIIKHFNNLISSQKELVQKVIERISFNSIKENKFHFGEEEIRDSLKKEINNKKNEKEQENFERVVKFLKECGLFKELISGNSLTFQYFHLSIQEYFASSFLSKHLYSLDKDSNHINEWLKKSKDWINLSLIPNFTCYLFSKKNERSLQNFLNLLFGKLESFSYDIPKLVEKAQKISCCLEESFAPRTKEVISKFISTKLVWPNTKKLKYNVDWALASIILHGYQLEVAKLFFDFFKKQIDFHFPNLDQNQKESQFRKLINNLKDSHFQNNALHKAFYNHQNDQIIDYLIEIGIDLSSKNKNGFIPLHTACINNHPIQLIKLLVEKGSDLNSKTEKKNTPLHYCFNSLENIQYLLEKKAILDSKNFDQRTPFHFACHFSNQIEVIQFYLSKGMDVNLRDNKNYKSPLHLACQFNKNVEIIKLLIEKGADLKALNSEENTAFQLACYSNNLRVVSFLFSLFSSLNGLDLNQKNTYGDNCLGTACSNNSIDVIQFLIEKGVNSERVLLTLKKYNRALSLYQQVDSFLSKNKLKTPQDTQTIEDRKENKKATVSQVKPNALCFYNLFGICIKKCGKSHKIEKHHLSSLSKQTFCDKLNKIISQNEAFCSFEFERRGQCWKYNCQRHHKFRKEHLSEQEKKNYEEYKNNKQKKK